MNIIRDQYNKQSLDNVNLTIETGAKRLIKIYDDIYAMEIMGINQLSSVALLQELVYRLRDNLLDVCDDMKALLNRAHADSAFVDQIKEIILMGGDLIDISVHYRDLIEESGDPSSVIEELYGDDSSVEDIISYNADTNENSLIPPVSKEDIINTAKENIDATKEATGDPKTVAEVASAATTEIINAAKSEETVATAEKSISDIVTDAKINATDPVGNSKAIEGVIETTVGTAVNTALSIAKTTAIASGINTFIGTVTGTTLTGAGVAWTGVGGLVNIVGTALTGLSLLGGAGIVKGIDDIVDSFDKISEQAVIDQATSNAANAYVNAIANGGTRQDAVNAARDAYNNSTYIPGVDEGVIHVEGTKMGDSPIAGTVDDALNKIETAVADAIREAGGDVSDYFGGCGCDDSCDCPDCGCDDAGCGTDCSSDCGCDDNGACPDCSSDTPCDGCDVDGCGGDTPSCVSDCSTDCGGDGCGVDYGCTGDLCADCTGDCGSDCSSDSCGCDDSCTNDCADCPGDVA